MRGGGSFSLSGCGREAAEGRSHALEYHAWFGYKFVRTPLSACRCRHCPLASSPFRSSTRPSDLKLFAFDLHGQPANRSPLTQIAVCGPRQANTLCCWAAPRLRLHILYAWRSVELLLQSASTFLHHPSTHSPLRRLPSCRHLLIRLGLGLSRRSGLCRLLVSAVIQDSG